MNIGYATIRRRYNQGLDSIVRLVTGLEDRIEDLMTMHVSTPQITIRRLMNNVRRLQQTIDNKVKELIRAHQLNVQFQARIRELEKSLEEDAAEPIPVIKRDSHNSNQPPSSVHRYKRGKSILREAVTALEKQNRAKIVPDFEVSKILRLAPMPRTRQDGRAAPPKLPLTTIQCSERIHFNSHLN